MPSVLYFETTVAEDDRPTFTRTMTKNSYIKSIFAQLDEEERLKYITRSMKKWDEFLEDNPSIADRVIPTLRVLLTRNEDVVLYFSSLGLPARPPANSYLLFVRKNEETGLQKSWSDLSDAVKSRYTKHLMELKSVYYEELVHFVDDVLPSDYLRCELFRNVKYLLKDYELATRSRTADKPTDRLEAIEGHMEKIETRKRLNRIRRKLFATGLSHEQKLLVDELCAFAS